MKQEEFKVGDRVRLCRDMCRQINIRKLYGTITNITKDLPPIEVDWDEDVVVFSGNLMYECELARLEK